MKAGKVPFLRNLARTVLIGQSAIVIPQQVVVPDISFWQDDNATVRKVDFVQMKANGARGVILRAGQNRWVDPDFHDYWAAAKAAGLPRGTYWFWDSRVPANEQADLFYNQFAHDWPEMEIVSDYEENYGGAYGGWQNLYNFLSRLISNGVPVSQNAIYSGYYYWRDHSPQTNPTSLNWFKQFKLWIAWYASNPANVSIPAPWTNDDLLAWQWTSSGDGHAYGVESNAIDLNWWNATPEQFDARYGGGTTPPPPTGGITMKGLVMAGFTINIRPLAGGTALGQLRGGDAVYGDVIENGYRIKYRKVFRADGSIQDMGQDCTSVTHDGAVTPRYYMVLTEEAEPGTQPPPPPPPPPPTTTETREFIEQKTMIDPDGARWTGEAHFILTKQP